MEDKYMKISDLNLYIKSMFDDNPYLKKVYLRGEISNFKNHSRGHLYFTLKDDSSRISAVMFYSSAVNINFAPEDGMNVLVEGRISCYPAQGTYQIYVDKMEVDGLGNLYLEFEKLKQKLASEGLFDRERKKEIPKIPKRIGIITAPTGAAISEARVPIISAVGHEIDFTIADFVADMRAPTPTGAAEMAVPTISEINNMISSYQIRLNEFVGNLIHKSKIRLDNIKSSYILKNPLSLYELKEQKLDNFIDILNSNIKKRLDNYKLMLDNIKKSYVLKNPMSLFLVKKERLIFQEKTLYGDIKNIILKNEHDYKLLVNTLKLVNPLGILEKGYSLVKKEDTLIKNSQDLKINDIINIRLYEGEVKAEVREVN